MSRAYHNLTARYNGYYYSGVNIDDGIFKIEKNNKDNFEKVLPIYVYPSQENAKSTFPEFDKAIKKSSFCIQRHTIKDSKGNEAPNAGKWIDNNWINIGISQFYKREFFSAIESFEYVTRTYQKSNDKYEAMIWLIKAYNEIGAVSSSEPLISLLSNKKNLPLRVSNELPVVAADYYMRRGMITEATTRLMEASRNSSLLFGVNHKKRARYTFITAQLFEQAKDNKRATAFYKKTIQLRPNYEMIFYSKIKMARLLDVKRNNSEKTKKDLIKMGKEFKNSDYYDVIFYTLGDIEEKERNQTQALYYYKRSVQTSVNNPNQKALSYLKLGEINFDRANYTPAEAYYDSAVVTLSKDHPDYKNIVARKKTLETLVGYMRTISKEDSLQRIAKMSDAEINAFIDKLIIAKEKEEQRKQQEQEAAKNANNGASSMAPGGDSRSTDVAFAQAVSFYFYSPNVVAFGIADFTKKWGNRKSEDNWRRSNRALTVEQAKSDEDSTTKGVVPGNSKNKFAIREAYKKNLPFNDSLLAKSNGRIIKAYYMLGSIYKEELNNTKKTISSFEELNSRFPSNTYLLSTYYTLYRIYQDAKNELKANYYKDKILSEFPNSEFALLIKNPNVAEEMNAQKSEVEIYYNNLYQSYHENNFKQSLAQSREGITKFGNNPYLPKFEFIKSLSLGKVKSIDSMEYSLKLLVAKYPNSEVTPLAKDILTSIKKQKNPEPLKPVQSGKTATDTFVVNLEAQHFIIASIIDDPNLVSEFKTNLNTFNSTYYSNKTFEVSSNLFGSDRQIVILKTFTNAKEVATYFDNLIKDKDLFKGNLKKENIEIFPISAENVPFLYKKKNFTAYKQFYNDHYKNLNVN